MFQTGALCGMMPQESPAFRRTMERYKESIPKTGLSLERGTSRVPPDGYYYVLEGGEIQARYRNLKQARRRYKELLVKSGWGPSRHASEDRAGDISREA